MLSAGAGALRYRLQVSDLIDGKTDIVRCAGDELQGRSAPVVRLDHERRCIRPRRPASAAGRERERPHEKGAEQYMHRSRPQHEGQGDVHPPSREYLTSACQGKKTPHLNPPLFRNIDGREYVDGHREDRRDAEDCDEKDQYDERIRHRARRTTHTLSHRFGAGACGDASFQQSFDAGAQTNDGPVSLSQVISRRRGPARFDRDTRPSRVLPDHFKLSVFRFSFDMGRLRVTVVIFHNNRRSKICARYIVGC